MSQLPHIQHYLQNGAKFIQKLTPGFKNHMGKLDNFRKAVESPKSWNSMGYICPKNTFLQLKHIQRIYLATTCVWKFTKFLLSFLKPLAIFHGTTRLYYFSSSITYFWQNCPIKAQIFRFFTTRVKIHQISHVIFQTKSELLFEVWITLQCHER